ncbi:MAG: 50S ribosomal protein L28 [Minisyncoccia bacterium]
MSRICEVTGKKTIVGGGYSNRTRATQFNPTGLRKRRVNLQKRRIFLPEIGKTVKVNVSTNAIRTMRKNGAYATLKKAGIVK